MIQVGTSRSKELHRRMCVRCGHAGRGVGRWSGGLSGTWCPNCGCDFTRRPPLSYAEMEGLDHPDEETPFGEGLGLSTPRPHREFMRRLERCLAVLFLLVVAMLVAVHFVSLGAALIG